MPDFAEVFTEGEPGNETLTVLGRNGSPIDKVVIPSVNGEEPHARVIRIQSTLQHECRVANSAQACGAFMLDCKLRCLEPGCTTFSSEQDQQYVGFAKPPLIVHMLSEYDQPI